MNAPPSSSAFPYVVRLLWAAIRVFRTRTVLALVLVILAKLATVAVLIALKAIVDQFGGVNPVLVLPLFLLLGYALLRFLGTLFGEIRNPARDFTLPDIPAA